MVSSRLAFYMLGSSELKTSCQGKLGSLRRRGLTRLVFEPVWATLIAPETGSLGPTVWRLRRYILYILPILLFGLSFRQKINEKKERQKEGAKYYIPFFHLLFFPFYLAAEGYKRQIKRKRKRGEKRDISFATLTRTPFFIALLPLALILFCSPWAIRNRILAPEKRAMKGVPVR